MKKESFMFFFNQDIIFLCNKHFIDQYSMTSTIQYNVYMYIDQIRAGLKEGFIHLSG